MQRNLEYKTLEILKSLGVGVNLSSTNRVNLKLKYHSVSPSFVGICDNPVLAENFFLSTIKLVEISFESKLPTEKEK